MSENIVQNSESGATQDAPGLRGLLSSTVCKLSSMVSGGTKIFVSPETDSALSKRIIVCCDGTWQTATSLDEKKDIPSNVTRLCRVLAKAGKDEQGNVWQQIVYYDAGLTTYTGAGLDQNVVEAYNFIASNYAPGDELYFFGFSRGAYTVRSVAGLVCDLGVLSPTVLPFFQKIYKMYANRVTSEKFTESKEWKEWRDDPANDFFGSNSSITPIYEKVEVEVIGVWDTVGNLGIPNFHGISTSWLNAHEFRNTQLDPLIKHAYQALALDERREVFSPAVWKLPVKDREKQNTYLCQCWFPGIHVNIGGGSTQNVGENPTGDREQLASITFAWMLDRIQPHLALNWPAVQLLFKPLEALADDRIPIPIAEKKQGLMSLLSLSAIRNAIFGTPKGEEPTKVGYAMGKIADSYSLLYKIINGPKDRTPGQYYDQKEFYTDERIHPSVYFRKRAFENTGTPYDPAPLRGWERKEVKAEDGSGFVWQKIVDGTIAEELWEFRIEHLPQNRSVERMLIEGSWAESVLVEVDKQWGNA